MRDQTRRKALIFLLIASVLTILIAASLPQLRLQPGVPLPPLEDQGGSGNPPVEPPVVVKVSTLFKTILAVVLTAAVLSIIYKILRKVSWKKILVRFFYFAVLVTIGVIALLIIGDINISSTPGVPDVLPPEIGEVGPPLAPMPTNLTWVVLAILAVVIVLLVVWLAIWGLRWRQAADDSLAQKAEWALESLKLHKDFKDVITQCYWQMSQSLRQERGIVLKETMTAREFELLAAERGIPYPPVHQLTQLFEFVRYGFRSPGPADEQKAIECLNAIVQFSRERKVES